MFPHPLAGIYVAAVTPLLENGQLDLDHLERLMAFYAAQNVHGILFFGTTGEGPSFSPAEREALLRAAARLRDGNFPHLRLMAGTGTPSLDESIALTRLAFALGYDAVVVLPPYYFRKATDDGLFRWFDTLIEKAVPQERYLLGYHIPGVAGVGFSLDLLRQLKETHPERFAGIKDSSHSIEHARALGKAFGRDLLVLNGTDSLLSDALAQGAQGAITAPANLLGRPLRRIWDAFLHGRSDPAAQQAVTAIRERLEAWPPFPPLLKGLLPRLAGLPAWSVRPPLLPAAPEVLDALADELRPHLDLPA